MGAICCYFLWLPLGRRGWWLHCSLLLLFLPELSVSFIPFSSCSRFRFDADSLSALTSYPDQSCGLYLHTPCFPVCVVWEPCLCFLFSSLPFLLQVIPHWHSSVSQPAIAGVLWRMAGIVSFPLLFSSPSLFFPFTFWSPPATSLWSSIFLYSGCFKHLSLRLAIILSQSYFFHALFLIMFLSCWFHSFSLSPRNCHELCNSCCYGSNATHAVEGVYSTRVQWYMFWESSSCYARRRKWAYGGLRWIVVLCSLILS